MHNARNIPHQIHHVEVPHLRLLQYTHRHPSPSDHVVITYANLGIPS